MAKRKIKGFPEEVGTNVYVKVAGLGSKEGENQDRAVGFKLFGKKKRKLKA